MTGSANLDRAVLDEEYAEHVAHLQRVYAALLDQHGFEAAVIHSGAQQRRSEADDQYWPLRPVPAFQHWLPLAEPDCALIVRPGHRPHLLRPRHQNFWEGPPELESDHWLPHVELTEIDSLEKTADLLPAGRLAVLGEARTPPALHTEAVLNPPALTAALDATRSLKTAYEVRCIAEANRRAALGHRAVAQAFAAGAASEFDLHLLFLGATRQDDAETPYKNILALGPHAATLHHITYRRTPSTRADESLLIDAGATVLGYTSDITRTHVRGTGEAASLFRALITGLNEIQQRLCAEAVPGLKYEDLHDRAHLYLGTMLHDRGILRASPEAAVATGLTRALFPHGLGHSLGLQCHDVGCAVVAPKPENPWLRNTAVIAPGQVFTIEPGIYFIDMLLAPLRADAHAALNWQAIDALVPFGGIRIEDDLHITSDPARPQHNLTRPHLP